MELKLSNLTIILILLIVLVKGNQDNNNQIKKHNFLEGTLLADFLNVFNPFGSMLMEADVI